MKQFDVEISCDDAAFWDDFVDSIIRQNEGQAIQLLANGKALDFAKVTKSAKEKFAKAIIKQQVLGSYLGLKQQQAVEAAQGQFQSTMALLPKLAAEDFKE